MNCLIRVPLLISLKKYIILENWWRCCNKYSLDDYTLNYYRRTNEKIYIVKWRRWRLRTTVLRLFDCDEEGSGINYYFVIYYKNLGDRVYKTAAAAVIDGYTDAVATRRLSGGVARAGIDVYRIKTYGQQVEDQHVWYLSRRFIWILTHTCEY